MTNIYKVSRRTVLKSSSLALLIISTPRLLFSKSGIETVVDLSDGLSSDIFHICKQSNSGCRVLQQDRETARRDHEEPEQRGFDEIFRPMGAKRAQHDADSSESCSNPDKTQPVAAGTVDEPF